MLTEDGYKERKLPYVKTEYGVVSNGSVVSLGTTQDKAGAKAYAKRRGLPLVSRGVSEWLEVK